MLKKYGPSNDWTGGLDRRWTLSGQLSEINAMGCYKKGQRFKYETGYIGYSMSPDDIYSLCGPTLEVETGVNEQLGIVTSLEIKLKNPVEMWRDYQKQWVYSTRPELRNTYQSLSSIVPAQPDL